MCGRPESINNLFFKCNFAQKVWAATPLMPMYEPRGTIDLEYTWTNLCTRIFLPPTGLIKIILAPWIMWQIWLARNNAMFNDRWLKPEDVVSKAIVLAREWETNQVKTKMLHRSSARRALVHAKCIMVRTDAAWKEDLMMAGLGWTIFDQHRTRSFAIPAYFVGSPLAAEGMALREAIMKCKELGYTHICCESDSSQLIQAVNSVSEASELYDITADIISIASLFEAIYFR